MFDALEDIQSDVSLHRSNPQNTEVPPNTKASKKIFTNSYRLCQYNPLLLQQNINI